MYHFYLWLLVGWLLLLITIYTFLPPLNPTEDPRLRQLLPTHVDRLSHDERYWYYDGKYTGVGYGECSPNDSYCVEGSRQAEALREAIDNGGCHPLSPLIY